MSTDRRTRAWIEVQGGAIRRNLRRIREAVGPRPALIPMVKADAYGLGMDRAVAALARAEPWGYGIAALDEGIALRNLGVADPILVVSPLPPGSYAAAVEAELVVSVSDAAGLRLLGEASRRVGRPASFHTEIDTGMGRTGFDWREAPEWKEALAGAVESGLRWTGCFTHFHSADEDGESVRAQWARFQDALRHLPVPRNGFLVHGCNSAAALRLPELAADAVRPGIFLYGGAAGPDLVRPEPVAALRARVVFVRDAPPGSTVGYGATHAAKGWERWATVAVGYGDGLPRALGNRGSGVVRGRRAPIVGRISMDVTVVDISQVEGVELGDVVTFLGRDGDEAISLEEVAELCGTINYEILTGLTQRLPRVWMEDGAD